MIDLPDGPVERIARLILGARLQTVFDGSLTEVILTEVEAYGGSDDAASHAFNGRTTRNESMFGPAGTLYVYRSYGVHWCANLVTGPAGEGQAVLLRAGVPVSGAETMRRRRGRADHVCDGPGKLCQAMGITGACDGTSVFDGPVRLLPPDEQASGIIRATGRIGITKEKNRLWRFVLEP